MIAGSQPYRWTIKAALAVGLLLMIHLSHRSEQAAIGSCLILIVGLIYTRLDYTHLWGAMCIPWIAILGVSALEISDYTRPVDIRTIEAIVAVLAISFVVIPTRNPLKQASVQAKQCSVSLWVNRSMFVVLLGVYLSFVVLNVILAGYIPLINAILTGASDYQGFGVPGVYGLFNAFANAFGLLAFYIWIRGDQRALFKLSFFAVMAVFILFLTRQNLVSLLVEAFLLYSVVVKRVSGFRIATYCVAGLVCFSYLGEVRSDVDISELAGITERFEWLPHFAIWLYSYCYFNILNLDNMIVSSPIPTLDGSSLSQLLPSFIRPTSDALDPPLEISNFTVSSFISPLYYDFGLSGLCVIFFVMMIAVRFYIGRQRSYEQFTFLGCYAVLYFCFAFSFFVNFWFYLPVITQLVFIPIFGRMVLMRSGRSRFSRTQVNEA